MSRKSTAGVYTMIGMLILTCISAICPIILAVVEANTTKMVSIMGTCYTWTVHLLRWKK